MPSQIKTGLFKIPKEPPVNEHGLIIPPKPIVCTDYPEQHRLLSNQRPDRHHLYWEKKSFQNGPYRDLRSNPRFIIKLCRHFHNDLHATQSPARRPTRNIARLAVQQAKIEHSIVERYQRIDDYLSYLDEPGGQISEKNIESIVDRLSDEIDEYKETLGVIFDVDKGVIPTQQYYIDVSGNLIFEDIPELTNR